MISNDQLGAALDAMVKRICNRVTRVIVASNTEGDRHDGVPDGRRNGSLADRHALEDSCAADRYVVTQVTPLHAFYGEDDDTTRMERAAIMEYDGGLPREIAEGLATLCAIPPPVECTREQWTIHVDAAARFADNWGAHAIAQGWTRGELFGLDPATPLARHDNRGLAVSLHRDDRVISITESEAAVLSTGDAVRKHHRRIHSERAVSACTLQEAA